ncbi:hypothetical protein VIGAN_UM018400, partial [Vigna angularis var. angularis]
MLLELNKQNRKLLSVCTPLHSPSPVCYLSFPLGGCSNTHIANCIPCTPPGRDTPTPSMLPSFIPYAPFIP